MDRFQNFNIYSPLQQLYIWMCLQNFTLQEKNKGKGKKANIPTHNLPPYLQNLHPAQLNAMLSQVQNKNPNNILRKLAMTSRMPNMAQFIQDAYEKSSNAGEFLQAVAPVLAPVVPPLLAPPMNHVQGHPAIPGPVPLPLNMPPASNHFNPFNFPPVPVTHQTTNQTVAPAINGQVLGQPMHGPLQPNIPPTSCLVNPFNGPPLPMTIQPMQQAHLTANQNIQPATNNMINSNQTLPTFVPQPNRQPIPPSMPVNQQVPLPAQGLIPGTSNMQQVPPVAQGFLPGPSNIHKTSPTVPGLVPGPSNMQQIPLQAQGFVPGSSNMQLVPPLVQGPVNQLMLNRQRRIISPRQGGQGMRQPPQRMLVGQAVRVPTGCRRKKHMRRKSPLALPILLNRAPASPKELIRLVNERQELARRGKTTSPKASKEVIRKSSASGTPLIKEQQSTSNSGIIDLTRSSSKQVTRKPPSERGDHPDAAHGSLKLSLEVEVPSVETGLSKSPSAIQSQAERRSESNKNQGNVTETTTKNVNEQKNVAEEGRQIKQEPNQSNPENQREHSEHGSTQSNLQNQKLQSELHKTLNVTSKLNGRREPLTTQEVSSQQNKTASASPFEIERQFEREAIRPQPKSSFKVVPKLPSKRVNSCDAVNSTLKSSTKNHNSPTPTSSNKSPSTDQSQAQVDPTSTTELSVSRPPTSSGPVSLPNHELQSSSSTVIPKSQSVRVNSSNESNSSLNPRAYKVKTSLNKSPSTSQSQASASNANPGNVAELSSRSQKGRAISTEVGNVPIKQEPNQNASQNQQKQNKQESIRIKSQNRTTSELRKTFNVTRPSYGIKKPVSRENTEKDATAQARPLVKEPSASTFSDLISRQRPHIQSSSKVFQKQKGWRFGLYNAANKFLKPPTKNRNPTRSTILENSPTTIQLQPRVESTSNEGQGNMAKMRSKNTNGQTNAKDVENRSVKMEYVQNVAQELQQSTTQKQKDQDVQVPTQSGTSSRVEQTEREPIQSSSHTVVDQSERHKTFNGKVYKKPRKTRTIFTSWQTAAMDNYYQFRSTTPSTDELKYLSYQLGLSENTIRVRFQNRRSLKKKLNERNSFS